MGRSSHHRLLKKHAPLLSLLWVSLFLWAVISSQAGFARQPAETLPIKPTALAGHFKAEQQDLSGLTVEYKYQPQDEKADLWQRALIAIPPGPVPKPEFLSITCSLLDGEEVVETTGPVDLRKSPEQIKKILRLKSVVEIRPLGIIRGVRVASLAIRPLHSYRRGQVYLRCRVDRLKLRLDFPPGLSRAGREKNYNTGFPSGYHGLFESLILNAENMPKGLKETPQSSPPPYAKAPALRLDATRSGYYLLPAERLKELYPKEDIRSGRPALYCQGRELPFMWVAWRDSSYTLQSGAGDAMLFYLPENTSPYSRRIVAYVSPQPGQRKFLTGRPDERKLIAPPAKTATQVDHFEDNTALWSLEFTRRDTSQHEYWIWEELEEENSFDTSLELSSPLASRGENLHATIAMHYSGRTTDPFSTGRCSLLVQDATVEPSLFTIKHSNNSRLLAGFEIPAASISTPTSSIRIRVVPHTINPASQTSVAVDWIELEYNKPLRLTSGGLSWKPDPGDANWLVSAPAHLHNTPWLVLGRTAKGNIHILPASWTRVGLYIKRTHETLSADFERIDLLPAAHPAPVPKVTFSPPTGLYHSRQADAIYLSHPDLLPPLELLAGHRRRQAYAVEIVSVSDVYRDFGDGTQSPEAIRAFLSHVYHHWQKPAPGYVLLAGEARWDYLHHIDSDVPNLMPTYHPEPKFSSDNWYACVSGEDPLPEFFISRLSVKNATDAEIAVRKFMDYDRTPPAQWQGKVLFFVDNEEDFDLRVQRQIQTKVPEYMRTSCIRIWDFPYVDNFYAPEEKRRDKRMKCSPACNQALMEKLNQGILLWEYYGHGSLNVLTEERSFFGGGAEGSDVKKMTNAGRLPVFLAWTCDTIQYDYSGEQDPPWSTWTLSMGEELLTHEGGGAIAVYGATGRGRTEHHEMLNSGFHDALFLYGFRTLGELTTASKILAYAQQQSDIPLHMFGLHGDILTAIPLPEPRIDLQLHQADSSAEQATPEFHFTADFQLLSPECLKGATLSLAASDGRQSFFWNKEYTLEKPLPVSGGFSLPAHAFPGSGQVHAMMVPPDACGGEKLWAGGTKPALTGESCPEVQSGTPDLVIGPESITFDPASPRNGETVFVHARVENRGDAPACDVQADAWLENSPEKKIPLEDRALYWEEPAISVIPPGQSRIITLRWDPFENAGRNIIRVNIDPAGRIRELSEQNNSATDELHVRTKADLVLHPDDVTIASSTDPEGYILRAAIRNMGQTPAEPSRIIIQAWDTEETGGKEPIAEYVIEKAPHVPLPPRRRASFSVGQVLPPSTRKITIEADPQGANEEETHRNNSLTIRVQDKITPLTPVEGEDH